MKIYVAGRFTRYERCRALIDNITIAGHQITNDWTRGEWFDQFGHPLGSDSDLPTEAQTYLSQTAIEGVMTADLVVILANEQLCGALIEMGVALANDVPVWVITPWRWTIFWTHPLVEVLNNEKEALERLGCLEMSS
jgi:nucleoside 2-deoxyribosyltransferase